MPKLEQVPGFNSWNKNEIEKNPKEFQRRQIAEFTAKAFDGDYQAVYLTEIKRGIQGEDLSHEFTSELIPSCRYGKITEKHLLRMRELFASRDDILGDPEFLEAKMVHGYHYFSGDNHTRKTVESANIRTMFELVQRLGNRPIVHLKSAHLPESQNASLEMLSGKEFQGVLIFFVGFEGMSLMQLTNFAPQFGLFNGAICNYKDLLYLPENVSVKLKPAWRVWRA